MYNNKIVLQIEKKNKKNGGLRSAMSTHPLVICFTRLPNDEKIIDMYSYKAFTSIWELQMKEAIVLNGTAKTVCK